MDKMVDAFKALSDKNRLFILDMLSCGEMCACEIMEGLELSQSTISHHMKVLQEAELVNGVKNGKWMNYSINKEKVEEIKEFITYITNYKEDCICNKVRRNSDDN